MLRDYQQAAKAEIYAGWNEGAANIMAVLPTGSGKTVLVGDILNDLSVPSAVIAHRQELLAQMCFALNREAVPHSIIAPSPVVRQIIGAEMTTFGFSHYSPQSQIRVAGVDTLIRRDPTKDRWFSDVQLTVIDEGHHVLALNKWGQAAAMFPNARGLFPTAHAVRGDGRGLGRHASGLVDRLVIGPSCRNLIDSGMLTDYRLFCPASDVNLANVHVSESGEFNYKEVRKAVHDSATIVGDVVKTYLRYAPGRLGITFAVDIESATDIAAEYTRSGIPAEVITGETPLNIRAALMHQFRERRILQLVSVDVLGEGVDVPAVEVISMARPTNSFQLFAQQAGRALRLLISDEHTRAWNSYSVAERLAVITTSTKPTAIILDHVQNSLRHGLPDVTREYTLNNREGRTRKQPMDAIPLRACAKCEQPFERYHTACPWCGHPVEYMGRATPEQVEGDLFELDAMVLRAMRKELSKVDGPCHYPATVPASASSSILRNHMARQQAQQSLRRVMALYGGYMRDQQMTEREAQKSFWHRFGFDVMSAQALGAADAATLTSRIQGFLDHHRVVEAAA